MIEEITLQVSPKEVVSTDYLRSLIARKKKINPDKVNDFKIIKKSIDARKKDIKLNLNILYATGEDTSVTIPFKVRSFNPVTPDSPVLIIVGAGPAGLFAALKAIELGIKPIVLERGESVEKRRIKLAEISRKGIVDPDTNYCFGEGGAGAYSDGKLFTRSKKRGNVREILELLHQFGASEDILIDAHAHIGSDKLPNIIKNIRETIKNNGGEILFNERVTDILISDNSAIGVKTSDGKVFNGAVMLATGHSAHDIYYLLNKKNVLLEEKGLAIGVRLEHPQELIDKIQYHGDNRKELFLPPAEYTFLTRIDDRAVYSFCMCPGGVVVPSMSSPEESLVNGMSASARSGKWANSAIVVEIFPEDVDKDEKNEALNLLRFQEKLEKDFYISAEKTLQAPAQRMNDFVEGKLSSSLPDSSYPAGLISKRVDKILPDFISERIKKGFKEFNRKASGFLTNEATVIGLESRTSSPLRIPRDPVTLEHVKVKNLYPAGEGAGYSGGIVSSAIDGQRCVEAFYNKLLKFKNGNNS